MKLTIIALVAASASALKLQQTTVFDLYKGAEIEPVYAQLRDDYCETADCDAQTEEHKDMTEEESKQEIAKMEAESQA